MTRGLKGSNFGKWVKGNVSKGWNSLVNGARLQLMAGVKKDLKRLGEKYTTMILDLETKMISCDDGPWKTPEEWNTEADVGALILNMLKMGMDMWHDQFNRKKVTVKLQKGDMIETTIQFDDGPVYGFRQVFDQHKNDPVDEKAKQLAQLVGKSDYSKEIVLKK